ncbi:hypothetical protein [Streptomyces abikoensis]|uniref:hypothetical protein n=1 Tax=Streptomyces abikoensis TaxID=97398 RepID=UPI0033FCE6C5
MADGGRRTRPWAALRGPTEEANALARLLRRWLDDAGGLRVEDVARALKPEHFENGRIPARSTVADRLAGVNPRWDFVEAVADACSEDDTGRRRLLAEARPYWRQIRRDPVRRADTAPPPTADDEKQKSDTERLSGELVAVQRHSLAVSDKLVRAFERVNELENARNQAHQMVLLLLAMVEKLRRDIADLNAERTRLRTFGSQNFLLRQVRERLERSESQRAQADAELARARAERDKADRLAEQAADRVRVLTDELERLRRRHPGVLDEDPAHAGGETPPPATRPDAPAEDDIDLALAKAASHLDHGADRLDRIADELRQEVTPPDNRVTGAGAPDNPPDHHRFTSPLHLRTPAGQVAREMDSARASGRIVTSMRIAASVGQAGTDAYLLDVLSHLGTLGNAADSDLVLAAVARTRLPMAVPGTVAALRKAGRDEAAYRVLTVVGRSRSATRVLSVVTAFRTSGHYADAYQILSAAGRLRPAVGIPPLVAELHRRGQQDDINWLLTGVSTDRPPVGVLTVAAALHAAGDTPHAELLLTRHHARRSSTRLINAPYGRRLVSREAGPETPQPVELR